MKYIGLFKTTLIAAFIAVMMVAALQISFAEDEGVTAIYKPGTNSDVLTLQRNFDPDATFPWAPVPDDGESITITENGVSTTYYFDKAFYEGNEVFGYFDDDGNALLELYECKESRSGGKLYRFSLPFEWVGGIPSASGRYAEYRYRLVKKNDPSAEPVYTNPIKIYIAPYAVIDGLEYRVRDDGTACVYEIWETEQKEFKIKDHVTLDDGNTYKVTNISASFRYCEDMVSIKIPNTIISIDSYAFLGATALKEVTIPSSVTHIGNYAFGYDGDPTGIFNNLVIRGKIDGFVIYAKAGSEGARYAKENGFKYIDLEAKEREAAADRAYEKARAEAATKKYTPAKAVISKLKAGKKKITVRWKKQSKATGYEFRYSTNKNFKKNVKKKKVTSYKKKGLTIKSLKKKKYYVQVRAYRKVNGKTYYGKWSVKNSVKVK